MTKKKLLILTGSALIVCALIAAGIFQYLRTNTPEAILYAALAQDTPDTVSSNEKGVAGESTATLSGVAKTDGTYKAEGQLTCKTSSADGSLSMDATIKQVQEEMFMKFNSIKVANAEDPATSEELNDYFASLTNKWILVTDSDPRVKGLKEKGVFFGQLGAISKNQSQKSLAAMLKKHKVITILDSKATTRDNKAAIEYDLQVRRSAYEKFLDEVQPGFKYKDDTLDALFTNDTEEIRVVVAKKDRNVLEDSSSTPNLCTQVMSFVSEDATDLPSKMRVTSTPGDTKKAEKITKPTDYIDMEAFATLLYGEETEE